MVLEKSNPRINEIIKNCAGFTWILVFIIWTFLSLDIAYGILDFNALFGSYESLFEYLLSCSIGVATWFIGPQRTKIQKISDLLMYISACSFMTRYSFPIVQFLTALFVVVVQFFLGYKEGLLISNDKSADYLKRKSIWLKPFYLIIALVLAVCSLFTVYLTVRLKSFLAMDLPITIAFPVFECVVSSMVFEIGSKKARRLAMGRKFGAVALLSSALFVILLASLFLFFVYPPLLLTSY